MLVLSRNTQEKVVLWAQGTRVVVQVLAVEGGRVRLGFEAPAAVRIDREEIDRRKAADRPAA